MVSARCITAVKSEFEKLGLQCVVELGVVEIQEEELSADQRETLRANLAKIGLELHEDKKSILKDQVKNLIIEMIYSDELPVENYSEYLSEKLNLDYTFLAQTFSEETGITVQQFIVNIKVERVKELLLNTNLSLTEIAYKLNYSSISHLSNQFKNNTGLTPSLYRKMMSKR